MKKILAVLALAICVSWLPATADAKKQKTESGKITRVEFNLAKGTVYINGVEHSMAEIKAKIAKENWTPKPNKNSKGDRGVEFIPFDENCEFLLDEDVDIMWNANFCPFRFKIFEPLIDFEAGFYTADEDKKVANNGYPAEGFESEKEELINAMNWILENAPGEDGSIHVWLNMHSWSIIGHHVTEYGKTSEKALPSLYLPPPDSGYPPNPYLIVPGNYIYKTQVEVASGTYNDEGPFNMSYTPIPDPKGMFTGVGIKDPGAMRAEKIKKIQTNIYRVLDDVKNKNINVINISGQRVLNSNNEVNIGNLSTGVYFLQVEDAVKKVVKE